LQLAVTDQAEIGLVDQSRGLERVARPFVLHALLRDGPELVVDEREQFRRRPIAALLEKPSHAE